MELANFAKQVKDLMTKFFKSILSTLILSKITSL